MNPVALQLGSITIYWYSICILSGILIGYYIAVREFKKEKLSLDFLSDYFFLLIPISIVGARIYYVIFEWQRYVDNPLEAFAIWNGGIAIHGALLAGIIFTIVYTRKKNFPLLKLFDIAAPVIILGQAIGRWGNFFNQEAYGAETTLSFLQSIHLPKFIIDGMYITDIRTGITGYWQPTFFYESLICLCGFILIMLVRRYKKVRLGMQSAIYFIVYGVARFFIESLRQDSLMLGNMKVAQLISLALMVVGIIFAIYSYCCAGYYHREEEESE